MADRVSVSITIGGTLSRDLLPAFVQTIQEEGLSPEWDGPTFVGEDLPHDAPLVLYGYDVAWGRLDTLERFCVTHRLPFARWSGGCPGAFGAERAVFAGDGAPRSFAASEDDDVMIGRHTAEALGSYEAIIAAFDAADFVVPPLRLMP